jgi:hypothetical protein
VTFFSDKIIEIGPNDMIVARAKVSMPMDNGPIHAESIIEAVPQSQSKQKQQQYLEVEEMPMRARDHKTPKK